MTAENLCVDHYFEEAIERLEEAVTSCRDGHVVSPEALEKLRTHADFAVNFLSEHSADDSLRQKELLLQFLLGLANLHEYLSHNAPLVGRPR
jgi:cellobiose-specific phosphotransferase system component IIA